MKAQHNQVALTTSSGLNDHAKGFKYDDLKRLEAHSIQLASNRDAFVAHRQSLWSGSDFDQVETVEPNPAQATFNALDNLTGMSADEHGRTYAAAFDATHAGSPPLSVNSGTIKLDEFHRTENDAYLDYTHDALNRLVKVEQPGKGVLLEIEYDGFDRRRFENKAVVNGGSLQSTYLEYFGGNVVIEHAQGAVTLATTHAPGLDSPLFINTGPTDEATATRLITNVRGDVIAAMPLLSEVPTEEAVHSPWGEKHYLFADGSSCTDGLEDTTSSPLSDCSPAVLNRFGIGGARADVSTKLVDLRHRVYATHLRGFLSPDPLGDVDSQGLWNYVAGDPINFGDSLGTNREEKAFGSSCVDGGGAMVNDGVCFVDDNSSGAEEKDMSLQIVPLADESFQSGFARGLASSVVEEFNPAYFGGPIAVLTQQTIAMTEGVGALAGKIAGGDFEWNDINIFRVFSQATFDAHIACADGDGFNCSKNLSIATKEGTTLVLGAVAGGAASGSLKAGKVVSKVKPGGSKVSGRGSGVKTKKTNASGREPACFVAGTLVATPAGMKAIESLQVGDFVYAFNEEAGEVRVETIERTLVRESDHLIDLVVNGHLIETTSEHPFFVVAKGWVDAGKIETGDELQTLEGAKLVVESVARRETPSTVFNLDVGNSDTFFVGVDGVLVHNADCFKRNLTADDLGLPKGTDVVGKVTSKNGKTTIKVDYIGSDKGLGKTLIKSRSKMKQIANDAGSKTLRIETSPVINPKLGKALGRAGFQARANGTMFLETGL